MASHTGMYFAYRTPYGPITIRTSEQGITHVALGDVDLPGIRHPHHLSTRAANELLEYFAGKRTVFDLPLDAEGSTFQRAVWDELTRIPYGQSRTTAEVARLIDRPQSYRSVGAAVKRNPLAILVPDHRVVAANGRVLGSGALSTLKDALLDAERTRAQEAAIKTVRADVGAPLL